jgi:hypothetical protein
MRARALAVLLLGLVLAGCTSSHSDGSPAGPASAAASDPAAEAARISAQYLPAATPTALATVRGQVRDGSEKDVPGTLELISVQAGANSTAVRWRIATDQPITSVSTNFYHRPLRSTADTSAVTLIAKQADLLLYPSVWAGTDALSQDCTCSWTPSRLGPDGLEMSSLYPNLPASVTEVQLKVPGFPAVTGPVTRK